MALFSELFGRLGNEDINSWLQVRAWQQSVLLAHTTNDVTAAPATVSMTTTHDVITAAEKDKRRLPATSGKRSNDRVVWLIISIAK